METVKDLVDFRDPLECGGFIEHDGFRPADLVRHTDPIVIDPPIGQGIDRRLGFVWR